MEEVTEEQQQSDSEEQNHPESEETGSSLLKARIMWAGAFMSFLVATNLIMSLFCSSWPLFFYLAAGGLGAFLAERLQRWFAGDTIWRKLFRGLVFGLAVFSFVGLGALFAMPAHWDGKCAWRYCSRALGPGLFDSPFPVDPVSCRGWSTCVNEYPYSHGEYRQFLRRIEAQGCPAP
jgi:hypothetical protein